MPDFGTDFNTGVSQMGPRFGAGRCYAASVDTEEAERARRRMLDDSGDVIREGGLPARARRVAAIDGTNYYRDGLANIGWLPEVATDLVALDTPGARQLANRSAEKYLKMWDDSNIYFNTEYVSGATNVIDFSDNILAIHGVNKYAQVTPKRRGNREIRYNKRVLATLAKTKSIILVW